MPKDSARTSLRPIKIHDLRKNTSSAAPKVAIVPQNIEDVALHQGLYFLIERAVASVW